ncbi:MAG: hypothetical protein LBD17_00640 [Endomicrobium sp.]|jgi:hypothetical protein|nr:hypothetical protein [Endomicrobium sp.]
MSESFPKEGKNLQIILILVTLVFVVILIFVGCNNTAQTSSVNGKRSVVKKRVKKPIGPPVVMIDSVPYHIGIFAHSNIHQIRLEEETNKIKHSLLQMNEEIFTQYEKNVDNFLDWYYSLGGDYQRLLNMAIGDLENFMITTLKKHLARGVDTSQVSKLIDDYKQSVEEYDISSFKNKYRLSGWEDQKNLTVVASMSEDQFNNFFEVESINNIMIDLDFKVREGLMNDWEVTEILKDLAANQIIGMAAKAVIKVISKKAMATGAGALLGGALGSYIPYAGTAAGSFIGGVILGIAADLIVGKIDEEMNKDDFKREIMTDIYKQKEEIQNYIETTFIATSDSSNITTADND